MGFRRAVSAMLCLAFVGGAQAQTSNGFNAVTDPIRPVRVYDAAGNIVSNFGGGGGGGASTVVGSQEQDLRGAGTLTATATSGATSFLDIALNGHATLGLRFAGLAASGATISYQQSIDGGTTYTAMTEDNTGTGVLSLNRVADGQVRLSAAGRTNIRLQVTTAGTGTISIGYNASVRAFGMAIDAPLPPGGNPVGFAGGGQYRLNPPTLTDLQYGYAALDSSSRTLLSPSSSVLANLQVAGAANASGNPLFAQITSGTVTANLGTLNGAALDTSVQAVRTALGSPFQAGANIGNSAFGISGTLPAFATTPTFNLGTLNGAALDSSVQQVKTTLGTPFQAGGSIANTSFAISGTLPAFAAPPTVNLGTLNGVALDASVQALAPKLYTLASNVAAASNGTATGAVKGADYVWSVEGSFAGLTGVLQVLGLDGTTWSTVKRADGTAVQCSAACATPVSIGQGRSLRISLTGTASGTPSIYSALSGLN